MTTPDFREEVQELYDKHWERMKVLTECWNEQIHEMMERMKLLTDVYDEMEELHDKMYVMSEKWDGGQ